MARKKMGHVTPGELEILRVLWKHGPMTVTQVHTEMVKARKVAPTTVASMMILMERDKGLLRLKLSARPFIYEAVMQPDDARKQVLGFYTDLLFGGRLDRLIEFAGDLKNGIVTTNEYEIER